MPDTAGAQPAPYPFGFHLRFRPQPVIYGERREPSAPRTRPSIRQQRKRHAVAAARNSNSNRCPLRHGAKMRDQIGEFRFRDRLGLARRGARLAHARSDVNRTPRVFVVPVCAV